MRDIIVGSCCCKHKFHGGIVFMAKHIVSWIDFETCSKVTENGDIGQNTYDFLLEFYSNFDRISYFSVLQSILCQNDLAGQLRPLSDS